MEIYSPSSHHKRPRRALVWKCISIIVPIMAFIAWIVLVPSGEGVVYNTVRGAIEGVLGGWIVFFTIRSFLRARRHMAIGVNEQLAEDQRPPILYLVITSFFGD